MIIKYSIQTTYSKDRILSHGLQFYYNPLRQPNIKQYTDNKKLSHAKKTLEHCRNYYPDWKHKIKKTITIIEILNH